MSRVLNRLSGLTLMGLLGLNAGAWADSLASSASSAGSASVGSLSDSVHGASNSSSRQTTAAGDYRVVQVAALAGRPGMLRLTLQPVARADEAGVLWLDLPQATWQAQRLGAGDLITAVARPYGLEIARADTRQAIYLLLADDWRHDLEARRLTL
ncbi:MAG: hypothetical protein OEW22_10360 [Rubrivivax sp.]|nr:hypothetical protein [Rubrivivax sp.]